MVRLWVMFIAKEMYAQSLRRTRKRDHFVPQRAHPGNAKLSRGYALMLSNILDRVYDGVVGLEVLHELVSHQRPLSYLMKLPPPGSESKCYEDHPLGCRRGF